MQVAQRFLRVVQSRRRRLGTVRVSDLDAFVREVAGRVSARTTADSCSALRSFLRFLHVNGHMREDLAACVIAPRVRHLSNPPRGLPWPDVRRLLHAVDRKSPRGNRGYAVLLLMASCGLGTAEVCGLLLDDRIHTGNRALRHDPEIAQAPSRAPPWATSRGLVPRLGDTRIMSVGRLSLATPDPDQGARSLVP